MALNENLQKLISAAEPLWAGEAEVVRTYFNSPSRSRESDLAWLRKQCKKEFWDSIHIIDSDKGMLVGPLEMLREAIPKIEVEIDRHEILELAEALYEEFSHYVAFADAYDFIRGDGGESLDPHRLNETEEWDANRILGEMRTGHRQEHGEIGRRACRFTEGGYCTLFSESMALAGRSPQDDAIASAGKLVYEDEFSHMLKGIFDLDDGNMSDADWALLKQLTTEQMAARIRMRNAQFGNPLSEDRIGEILEGKIEPIRFDYDKAQLAA